MEKKLFFFLLCNSVALKWQMFGLVMIRSEFTGKIIYFHARTCLLASHHIGNIQNERDSSCFGQHLSWMVAVVFKNLLVFTVYSRGLMSKVLNFVRTFFYKLLQNWLTGIVCNFLVCIKVNSYTSVPGHCNLCDILQKALLKCHWQYYWASYCAFFFYAEASVWGEVDGGNGLVKAMAGEDGYV